MQQLSLAVDQWEEGHRDVVVRVEIGARAAIVIAVGLHGDQRREVTPRVTKGDRAFPAKALFP